MSNPLRSVGASDALAVLRSELEALTSQAAASDLRSRPLRTEDTPLGDHIGIWYESPILRVHTCENDVFVCGRDLWDYADNWTPLSNRDAREIASALLSATAYTERCNDNP